MIVEYKKIARNSLLLIIGSIAANTLLLSFKGSNVGQIGNLLQITILGIAGVAVWVGFWSFAKAKGYSAAVGIALPFLSVVGLIILLALPDKSSLQERGKLSSSDTQYKCVECHKTIQGTKLSSGELLCPSCGGHLE